MRPSPQSIKTILPQNLAEFQKRKCSTIRASQDYEIITIDPKIDGLFISLGNIFFEKFTARFPTPDTLHTAKQIWQKALAYYSVEQIAYGIEQCHGWTADFAPTLPQFLELCKMPVQFSEQLRLPSAPRSPSERREELQKALNSIRTVPEGKLRSRMERILLEQLDTIAEIDDADTRTRTGNCNEHAQ